MTWVIERIRLISWAAIFYQTNCRERGIYCFDGEIYYWSNLTTRTCYQARNRRSAWAILEVRLTRMKFITLHLSQSRARIALRSRTLLRSPSARSLLLASSASRVARPDVHRRSSSSVRSRSHLRKTPPLYRAACRIITRRVYGRRGRRTKRRTKTERRSKRSGKKTSQERRTNEETRASRQGGKGRDGDWERERSVEVTRLHASRTGPASASASERTSECARWGPPKVPTVPARGEAPARLSRMLLHAMLLRYTSNIKVEEGMEKRATWANSMRNGQRETARAGKREGEKSRVVGRRWSAPRWEREREENGRRGGEGGTTQQSCIRGALLISAFVHLRPPRWFVSAGLRETNSVRLCEHCERTGSTSEQFLRTPAVIARESERLDLYGF